MALESYYRMIRPTVPASGDYSKILPLIEENQKTPPNMAIPDPLTGKMVVVEGYTSPRKGRVDKDLMLVITWFLRV